MTINLFLIIQIYILVTSLLAPLARRYLDKMVDWDHGNVYKDLHKIAQHMLHWDSLAAQLGLDDVDIADIKHDHHTAEQQRLGFIILFDDMYSVLHHLCFITGLLHCNYGSRELHLVHTMIF